MNESSGSVMIDTSPSHLDGVIGTSVMLGGSDGYLFPGWTGNVDPTGHLAGTVSATGGAVAVPDPLDVLDPRTASFSVSLGLEATLTASGTLPTAPGASYNIVQKARADDPGGFWKLELGGGGTALGKLRWVLSDGSAKVVVTSKQRVDDGAWHTVVAERRGAQSVLTVDGVSATVSAASVGDIHPTGKYNATMTVGKKPGSPDPSDAFAGRLKELVITH
jgi:Laminin G domain